MSPANHSVRILSTLLLVSVASCRAEERGAEDARAVYGCYVAQGAPSFFLSGSGMRVEGSAEVTPFRYEPAKVGLGIMVPLKASRSDGRLSFVPSAGNYFYRRAPLSDPPVIVVAFDSMVVNYRRSDDANCAV